jgi:hypothetical protein
MLIVFLRQIAADLERGKSIAPSPRSQGEARQERKYLQAETTITHSSFEEDDNVRLFRLK